MDDAVMNAERGELAGAHGGRLVIIYAISALASLATPLLTVAVFFYTKEVYRWSLTQNLLLGTVQGLVYVGGALSAERIVRALGRTMTVIATSSVMAGLLAAALWMKTPAFVAGVVVIYSAVSAVMWPAVESLIAAGVDAQTLSRRLGHFNIQWSAAGALDVAISGTVIERWPSGMLMAPLALHVVCVGLLLILMAMGRRAANSSAAAVAGSDGGHDGGRDGGRDGGHLEAEGELRARRRQALWLSRICLPAAYVALYGLMAMMPSLPAIQGLKPTVATVVGSVWLVARLVSFGVLGSTRWWHTRPNLLLGAAALMALAFAGVVVRPSVLFGAGAAWVDLLSMVLWQVLLGVAIGMIYTGSLYFGMVLSEGSTEHGGYHEALVGTGQFLGPALALGIQHFYRNSAEAGAAGIVGFLALSVGAAAVASARFRRSNGRGLAIEARSRGV